MGSGFGNVLTQPNSLAFRCWTLHSASAHTLTHNFLQLFFFKFPGTCSHEIAIDSELVYGRWLQNLLPRWPHHPWYRGGLSQCVAYPSSDVHQLLDSLRLAALGLYLTGSSVVGLTRRKALVMWHCDRLLIGVLESVPFYEGLATSLEMGCIRPIAYHSTIESRRATAPTAVIAPEDHLCDILGQTPAAS